MQTKIAKVMSAGMIFILACYAMANEKILPKEKQAHEIFIADSANIRRELLNHIAPIIESGIAARAYPGAVVLAGHRGQIIYRGVFGYRRVTPDVAPMEFNTMFDLASLTKVIATTTAVMQLVEQGQLNLDKPVASYWKDFAGNGKAKVTIRQLLTHTSGLEADVRNFNFSGQQGMLKEILSLKLIAEPGTNYLYSDINFIILAYLVERVSHEKFADYTETHIFKPLHMIDTRFLPPEILRGRIAPTEIINGKLRWGEVHDPSARAMGGVSGNAGLFSTANDLAEFADCLLNKGLLPADPTNPQLARGYLLSPLTIVKMTTVQTPETLADARGLGWDIDSSYSVRGVLFPTSSYGHTGWTGTSIWIDPISQTWLVILTSRTHPKPSENNQLIADRSTIANIIAASIVDVPLVGIENTGTGEMSRAY